MNKYIDPTYTKTEKYFLVQDVKRYAQPRRFDTREECKVFIEKLKRQYLQENKDGKLSDKKLLLKEVKSQTRCKKLCKILL